VFRKIAVVFVLFIGFFYTMPQMKGAGTTLAYIFQDVDLRGMLPDFLLAHNQAGEALVGLPYWAGVVLVGAIITLNVALGGMKGITLVQAFQYWIKMFAISVPIFVLMAVYGHYGKQLGLNPKQGSLSQAQFKNGRAFFEIPLRLKSSQETKFEITDGMLPALKWPLFSRAQLNLWLDRLNLKGRHRFHQPEWTRLHTISQSISRYRERKIAYPSSYNSASSRPISVSVPTNGLITSREALSAFEEGVIREGFCLIYDREKMVFVIPNEMTNRLDQIFNAELIQSRQPLPEKAPADSTWLNPFGPLTTKAAKAAKPELRYEGPLS
jgi:hypothetical protein